MTRKRATDEDELITLTETAKRYGFSPGFPRELAERGRLPALKQGQNWVTTACSVEKS